MSHHKQIFLDHASTTPVQTDVLGVMLPYFGNHFGTSTRLYELSEKPKKAVEQARIRVAQLIGAHPSEIIFTGSGTEANNMAILGTAAAAQSKGKHIITSAIEHGSVLNVCRHLESKGFDVTYLPVDTDGMVDPGAVENAIRGDTILISVMHVNNEVGTIEPIEKIGAIARKNSITFHSDAVQSAGKIPVNVEESCVDLLSISSHKIYGPKGIGALYIREKTKIEPIMFGSVQEKGLRPGTLNVPGIIGLGMACEVARKDLENNMIKIKALRDSLEQQITGRIEKTSVNGPKENRLPHISSISFDGILAASLGANLDAKNIFVSTGHPQRDGNDLSHVLAAMQINPEQAAGTIRFSLGWENKEREIKYTMDCLQESVNRLREFSRSSDKKEVCIITFPDRNTAASAQKILEKTEFSFTLIAKPADIMQFSCSYIALACLSSDRQAVGGILGELGVEIAGTHTVRPQCKTTTKKEQAFWAKVKEIKKGI